MTRCHLLIYSFIIFLEFSLFSLHAPAAVTFHPRNPVQKIGVKSGAFEIALGSVRSRIQCPLGWAGMDCANMEHGQAMFIGDEIQVINRSGELRAHARVQHGTIGKHCFFENNANDKLEWNPSFPFRMKTFPKAKKSLFKTNTKQTIQCDGRAGVPASGAGVPRQP